MLCIIVRGRIATNQGAFKSLWLSASSAEFHVSPKQAELMLPAHNQEYTG